MQQQIISSSYKVTPTKYTHNSFSHLLQHTLSFKLISLISLIFISVLIEAAPVPNTLGSITSIPNLISFANYAAATYSNRPLQNWDCGEVCLATKGTQLVKEITNPRLNTRGYIAKDPEKQAIIVAFRGTVPGSIRNYITDIIITATLGNLHLVGFTGHSLGGALATLSALDAIHKAPELAKNENLFLTTFGQPRVGDKKFAKFVDENIKAIRTIVRGDPIPRLPPSWPIPFIGSYKHFGEELYIVNPDQNPAAFIECSAEDPQCSESVPLGELRLKYHGGPYYTVNMGDANREPNEGDENYDYSADPYFNYDPNYNYGGAMGVNGVDGAKRVNATKEVNSTKEVNGTKGVNGTKEVDGTKKVKGTKGVNGVDRAKGYR
ncbi:unnamed protein product [Rhizophagus irregularis]|nr:unnamed protein product [Rhizophagus irregularis]